MKRPIFSSLITCIFIAASFSLSAQIYDLSGTLSGANEVPPTASMGTGTITGTYDQGTGMIDINITYSGLGTNGTASHIHDAPAGSNGGVIINLNLPAGSTSGNYGGMFALAAGDEANFLAGDTYVNIHSEMAGAGEIRGQIIATLAPAIPTLGSWSLAILAITMLIIGSIVMKYRTKLT